MENAACANFFWMKFFGLQFCQTTPAFARALRGVRGRRGPSGKSGKGSEEQYDKFQQFPFYWLGLVEVLVGVCTFKFQKKNK